MQSRIEWPFIDTTYLWKLLIYNDPTILFTYLILLFVSWESEWNFKYINKRFPPNHLQFDDRMMKNNFLNLLGRKSPPCFFIICHHPFIGWHVSIFVESFNKWEKIWVSLDDFSPHLTNCYYIFYLQIKILTWASKNLQPQPNTFWPCLCFARILLLYDKFFIT